MLLIQVASRKAENVMTLAHADISMYMAIQNPQKAFIEDPEKSSICSFIRYSAWIILFLQY